MWMKIQSFLTGKKTHIIAGLMVLVSLVNMAAGEMSLMEFVGSEHARILLEGLGLSTLRAGVAKAVLN